MKTQKINYWKIAALIIGLILIVLMITNYLHKDTQDTKLTTQYTFLNDLDTIAKLNNPDYVLCNINTRECQEIPR